MAERLGIARRTVSCGPLWHAALLALCAACASSARAQDASSSAPAAAPEVEPAGPTPDAGPAPDPASPPPAPAPEPSAPATPPDPRAPGPRSETPPRSAAGRERASEPRSEPPASAAGRERASDRAAAIAPRGGFGASLASPHGEAANEAAREAATSGGDASTTSSGGALALAERPRGWRMRRETVLRPLTLPQGVLRFDSIVTLSAARAPSSFGGTRVFMSGSASVAAGLHDDVEIGTGPLFGITWIPLGFSFSDPLIYARIRALSGDVQLAFRGGTTIPIAGQLEVAQMELATELAILVLPWLRVDTGVDYALRLSDPLHQRVGVPLVLTAQAGIHAVSLASAFFVFNDFDDVDVPLLLRYAVSFRGYQGPIGEWAFEGGFTDLEDAPDAWIMQSRFTFFAYL